MAFKQPRVPEYQNGESAEAYIRKLVLFLKDFCADAWIESKKQESAIRKMAQKMDGMDTPGQGGAE
ncbi:MAG: hypothetical protein IKU38_10120 [Clostridia bacterium]|nr:hypothetical protein [Clostridia bacterium]